MQGTFWSFIERLVLTYNPKTQIQLIVNETAHTVPVLDYSNNITTLYNGRTRSALSFNFETGISVFIPPGSSKMTWDSSEQSFTDFFAELPSQTKIYKYGETHGVRFDPMHVPEDISEEMGAILESVSQEYKERCEALSVVLHISRITSNYFKTSMVGYPQVMGSVNAEFRGDLKWLFGFYQGLGEFFGKIDGGMTILAKKKVKLDLGKALTEKTGIHVMIYFLKVLHEKFDVGKLLGKDLNSVETFFPLVDMLGGMLGYGFDGFVHILSEIVRFKIGHNSIQNVETLLNEYCSSPKTNRAIVKETWKGSIDDFLKTLDDLKVKKDFKGLSKVLTEIREGRWIYKKVDLGKISKVIMKLEFPCNKELVGEILNLLGTTS